MATLENGSDCDGELLSAGSAEVNTMPHTTTLGTRGQFRIGLFLPIVLAMRANRTIGPTPGFKQRTCLLRVRVFLRELCQCDFLRIEFGFFCFHLVPTLALKLRLSNI